MSLSQPIRHHLSVDIIDQNTPACDPRKGLNSTPRNSSIAADQPPIQRPPISTLPLPRTPSITIHAHERLLGPMPPSSDSELLHQRLSEIRTALDTSLQTCANLESQVEGLKLSLHSKHEESSRLQMDLSKAVSSLDLIQASWMVRLSLKTLAVSTNRLIFLHREI